MITCPKCQTPNPDTATTCLACGAGFAGEQFAAALDRAQGGPPADAPAAEGAAPAAPAPLSPEGGLGATPDPLGADPLGGLGGPPLLDQGAAQAEINQFVAAQKARKRKKAMVWIVLLLIGVGVIAFLAIRSAARKAAEEEIARFYLDFRKVDDGPMADFFRCAVRAKHLDVRLAKDSGMLLDGLKKAYGNFPKSQPGRITKKCLPLLDQTLAGLTELDLPDGMDGPMAGLKKAIEKTKEVFISYVEKLAARADQTANEKAIMEASGALHIGEKSEADKAAGYALVLECAVPDLAKMIKSVKKVPDAQPVIEYMHVQCKDSPKSFSDKLRKECVGKLTELGKDPKKPAIYKLLMAKMAGDDRDRMALDYCFKRANQGFFTNDLNTISDNWFEYRTARGKILDEVAKHKQE